jgi:predicted nucleic acid-binding protein
MSGYSLDTNAVSDLMREHQKVVAKFAAIVDRCSVSVIVRGEIQYGLGRLPPGKRRTSLTLKAERLFAQFAIEPVTKVIADRYGEVRRQTDPAGISCDDNDLWIAATCLILDATLVTRDSVFSRIPGLRVEDWTAS